MQHGLSVSHDQLMQLGVVLNVVHGLQLVLQPVLQLVVATGIAAVLQHYRMDCCSNLLQRLFPPTEFNFSTDANIWSPFAILHFRPCIVEVREQFIRDTTSTVKIEISFLE